MGWLGELEETAPEGEPVAVAVAGAEGEAGGQGMVTPGTWQLGEPGPQLGAGVLVGTLLLAGTLPEPVPVGLVPAESVGLEPFPPVGLGPLESDLVGSSETGQTVV
jgi:hypothetical protein